MLNKLIDWFNARFRKPYGVAVKVVQVANGMYKVQFTRNGNSLAPYWHDYWSALNDDVATIIDGVAYFDSEAAAVKTADRVYTKYVDEKSKKNGLKNSRVVYHLS